MASMYTSSNQYPEPNAVAVQCKTATTPAMPTTPLMAKGDVRHHLGVSVSASDGSNVPRVDTDSGCGDHITGSHGSRTVTR